MEGIILAGGTSLNLLTRDTNEHLLPVHDELSGWGHVGNYLKLLSSGASIFLNQVLDAAPGLYLGRGLRYFPYLLAAMD